MIDGKNAYTHEVVSTYDRDREVEPIWDEEQKWIEIFTKSISQRSSILDVPVGTGRFFSYYKKMDFKVTGIDISQAMLNASQEKAKKVGINVNFHKMGIENLDLPDNNSDYSICWRLLHLFPTNEIKPYIAELARVTKRKVIIEVLTVRTRRDLFIQYIKRRIGVFIPSFIRHKKKDIAKLPWGHIQAYAHNEKDLLRCFQECGLIFEKKHVFQNDKRVRVYCLNKAD